MISLTRAHSVTNYPDFDKADVIRIIRTIYQCVDENGEPLANEVEEQVYDVAVDAARALHTFTADEGDAWDGVSWYELLEDNLKGSLVYRLADECICDEKKSALTVVIEWLKLNNALIGVDLK